MRSGQRSAYLTSFRSHPLSRSELDVYDRLRLRDGGEVLWLDADEAKKMDGDMEDARL